MTTATRRRWMAHQAHGDQVSEKITLPCIWDRLSRFERQEFSYDELLHDFASRRRVDPVDGALPVKHVPDAAKEVDDIVQAYLSLNGGAHSRWSARSTLGRRGERDPLTRCGLSATGQGKLALTPQRQTRKNATSELWQRGLEAETEFLAGGVETGDTGGHCDVQVKDCVESTNKGTQVVFLHENRVGVTGVEGSSGGCHEIVPIPEAPQDRAHAQRHDSLERHIETFQAGARESSLAHHPGRDRTSGPQSSLWCSMRSSPPHDSFDYYPTRPFSAGAVVAVSLISPRMSMKIRRLPQPADNELQSVQRLENAMRKITAQQLERKAQGGLYSTIGRKEVGLIETDIDEITATGTGRTEMQAATERALVEQSLAQHSGGVLARLLEPDESKTLPTVNPSCYHGPLGSRPQTAGRIGRTSKMVRGSRGRSPVGPSAVRQRLNRVGLSEKDLEEDLKCGRRARVFEVDETQHCKDVQDNLRRLRALLSESHVKDEIQRAESHSLFSVHELRVMRTANKRRQQSNTGAKAANAFFTARVSHEAVNDRKLGEHQSAAAATVVQQEGTAVELTVGGNALLRNLARSLFSSIQRRLRKELMLLGFRKWKAWLAERATERYVKATLLIQCCLRRALAILETSERRRIRDKQAQEAKGALERLVRQRQITAIKLQRWIRGEAGRRRANARRCLWHAARRVQNAARQRASRARARRWREEQRRIREARARDELQERELRDKLRKEMQIKVELLERQEVLFKQRCQDSQERFRRNGAAARIQASWRAFVLKRNLSTVVRIGKRARAICIQCSVRVWLAKRKLAGRRRDFRLITTKKDAASIKIQALVRRRIASNRVDQKRFERSKEQLVSKMDAERALRVKKVKVPRLRAFAAREGSVLSAEGKGKPYVIDPIAFKILLADKRRAINPWQQSTDRKAATKIQAFYRRHRQVVRIRRMRVQRRRQEVEHRRRGKVKAANDIQRVFRGKRARVEAKSRRYGLRAVRVQKVWRGFLGRRAAAERRQRVQAAAVLQRRLRGAQARSLAARMRREAATTSTPAVAIQAAARRYLARRRFNSLVRDMQRKWELSTMATEMSRFCIERARLRVIVEGASAPNCRGDGVTQFIFRKIAVKRSGEEGSGSFRLEGRMLNKLFASTPGVFSSTFHATDIDLVFARVKDKDEKTLTYTQFIAALNVVAASLFPEIKRFRDFRAFKAKAARLLELVDGKVLKAPAASEYRNFCQKAGERLVYRSATKIQATVRGYLGRKRVKQKRLQGIEEARIKFESSKVVIIQALGRRYRARCHAIRLAQAKITKFIDPNTHLPYWVNPVTGVTTWSKPKVLGAEDVEHTIVVATPKTEHLVKCSVCDVNPVKRMCNSCRDSYCEGCFQALHGKGKRRTHVAPMVHTCCVCEYQHASRVCETCTFKTGSTCGYCDVCFFHRHPGLDDLSKAEAAAAGGRGGGAIRRGRAGAQAWTLLTGKRQTGWNHRWTPLVVICVECRRYAARWLCDDCEEVYCVGCYASVHTHGSKVKHGAEKLPYYPVDLHMEYAMACRDRSRKGRDEEARARRKAKKSKAREVAAIKIQAAWRGRVGRVEGRAYLKAGRAGIRAAWRQRKRDDRMRKALWYKALDCAGLAPHLASDRVDERVLKRIPRMARTRPRKYIALNREDDAWVPGKLDGRKGIIKRGFDFGRINELKDQAKRGGVRLPGVHSVKEGHRCIYTDPRYDMADFVKPKNIVRVHGEPFNVEAIEEGRIRVDHVWRNRDVKRVLLYKMILNSRQKLQMRALKAFWSSQGVQFGIQMALVLEKDLVNRSVRKAAKRFKKKRKKRFYTLSKKVLKRSERRIRSLELTLNSAQFGVDNSLVSGETDVAKEPHLDDSIPKTDEAALAWVESVDEATGTTVWRNTVTGEVTTYVPPGMKKIEEMNEDLEKKKQMLRAKKAKKH